MKINNKLQIDWHHDVANKTTQCVITKKNLVKDTVVVGTAKCSKGDIFCKKSGRNLSLKRAISQTKLNRKQRTEVWETLSKKVKLY